jgi:hypothetical protein
LSVDLKPLFFLTYTIPDQYVFVYGDRNSKLTRTYVRVMVMIMSDTAAAPKAIAGAGLNVAN